MDTQGAAHSTYPFCPFFDPDSHFVAQHVQYCHPENESPTVSQPENQASALSGRRNGGSSSILNSREHVENAVYLDRSADSRNVFPSQTRPQDGGDMSIRSRSPLHDGRSENSIQTNSKKAPNRSIKRLGRSELGPYAHEKKMPSWLLQMLHKGNATTKINKITPDGKLSKHVVVDNEASDVIPALAQLCKQDKSVQRTFLCSPHVHHIFKMPREGSFCGYRNIQMLVSYMQESRCPGSEHFPGALPSILQLQDRIERAWDMGFNSIGRAETGGIKGTRKYIGTSEAQALFLSLDIQCEAISIAKTRDMPAHSSLLSHIAAYFRSACALDDETEKVVLTNLPPIYFQHHGSYP
ncbi:peptidase family C78-domain-containing protein [Aspergillus unguis]